MWDGLINELSREVSGDRAAEPVADIVDNDRWGNFERFRDTAELIRSALTAAGLSSIAATSFPADGRSTVGDHVLPRAYEPRSATLDVIAGADEPRRIADYRRTPHALFAGSAPTGVKGEPVEAEAVEFEPDRGGDKVDLKGKVLFTGSAPADVRRAALHGGAIGIVTDWSRTRHHTGRHVRAEDLVFHPDNPRRLWGFAVSEHEGRLLRERLAAGGGKGVRLRAAVNARSYEGRIDALTAVIPGTDPGLPEVLLFAAAYRPGAFDNAAGVGAALEIARALQSLIKQGRLAGPRRSIRFLFGPRVIAPLAHLMPRPGGGVRALPAAGLALHGVGLDESRHPYCYSRSPEPTSPAADLVLDRVLHHPAIALGHPPGESTPFDPEAAPPADPMFGVSFPVLTQSDVPAELRSGSSDTAAGIDPGSLKTAATAGAAALYFLAAAGSTEAAWMAHEAHARSVTAMQALVRRTNEELLARLSQVAAGAITRDVRLHEVRRRAARRLTYLRDRCFDALGAIARYAAPPAEPRDEPKRSRKDEQREEAVGDPFRWTINDIAGRTERAHEDAVDSVFRTVDLEVGRLALARGSGAHALGITADLPVPESFQEHLAGQLIPARATPGLPTFQTLPEAERPACRWGPSRGSLSDELLWADGRRTIRDIHRMIDLHGRSDLSRLMEVYTYLASTGHVELTRKGAPEFTREQLAADLRALGVPEGKPLIVHSRLEAVGYVVGGAVAVLDALQDAVGEGGTLVMPTCTRPGELFLPDYTPCADDLLAEFLRFRSGALRSVHPTHSAAALGKDAAHIVDGHRKAGAAGEDSPLHRAARKGGWILLLGVGHEHNATIHVAEALAGAPYLALPYSAEYDRPFRTLLPDGTLLTFESAGVAGCPRHLESVQPALEAAGKVRAGRVGLAGCRLIKADDLIKVVRELLDKDPTALLCRQTSCPFCHRARAAAAAK